MKLSIALLVMLGGSGSSAQTTIPCPPAGSSSVLPGATNSSPLTVRIPIISNAAGLCTLVRRDADGSRRAPVARSYAGRQWEISAGIFTTRTPTGSTSSSTGLASVDCSAGSEHECDVTLPALESAGQEYVLESFEHSVTPQAEAARFLEQATFGPQLEDINTMVSTSNNYTSWVYEQIYELPTSSLRQFYRKHVNPKNDVGYAAGTTASRPCELFSRWRKYAITSKDTLDNRKTDIFKILQVEYVAGVGYIWKVDNQFRTVTQQKPVLLSKQKMAGSTIWKWQPDPKWGSSFELGGMYRIREWDWMTDCVGCIVPISFPAPASLNGYHAVYNPEVSIEGVVGTSILPYNVVSLPAFKSVDFPVIDNPDAYSPIFEEWMGYDEHAILNTTSLEESNQCDGFPDFRKSDILNPDHGPGRVWKVKPTVFGKTADGHTFAYDPHLALPENTVKNPNPDGGGQLVIDTDGLTGFSNYNGMYDGTQVMCQNSVRTYLNEDHCKLSYLPSACNPDTKPNRVIILNDENLAGIRALTGKKVYAVQGLPLLTFYSITTGYNAPCGKMTYADQTSRWIRDEDDHECDNTANLSSASQKIFRDIIDARNRNSSPNIVDATRAYRNCDSTDENKLDLGKIKATDGSCWRHSHHQEKDVFDFSSFSSIDQYVISGTSTVSMPLTTLNNLSTKVLLGKLDEHVFVDIADPDKKQKAAISKVPLLLKDENVQDAFKTVEYNPASTPVLVCGSVDEVASDPTLGERGFEHVEPEGTGYRSKNIHRYSAQRHTVWAYLAMNAKDQLRMRTAWALSQIVAVGLPGSGMTFFEPTEDRLVFYDHFVNHAFGIYRDLMKDFSYSLIMANWLSYKDNKSLHYNLYWSDDREPNYPDENFAREIMQLFSIGLHKLNMDGSHVLLPNGKREETYTIEDIMSYSRAWTGFVRPKDRGGVSAAGRQWSDTPMDPMPIEIKHRDVFPKSDLMNGFIGDKVPLCVDLPTKHFLRKGATFKLLGSRSTPELHNDITEWEERYPELLRLEVGSSSPLFIALCAADSGGSCTFPSKVVLDENLVYDLEAQNGAEYMVDTIRSVKLQSGLLHPIHYEYVRQPCVEHAFYNDAKKVAKGSVAPRNTRRNPDSAKVIEGSMCADTRLPSATPMCTSKDWATSTSWGLIYCNYHAERVTFTSAQAICEGVEGAELVQGQPGALSEKKAGPCAVGVSNSIPHFRWWTSVGCDIKVKIAPKSGQVAIVHDPQPDEAGIANVEPLVDEETLNFFKVPWTNNVSPSVQDCKDLSCSVSDDEESCFCSSDVIESQVYSSVDETYSIDDFMNTLHIGAADPSSFDLGTYTIIECGITGVTVYSTTGDCAALAIDTIFGFEWKSKQYFLKNSKSIVKLRGSNDFSFRNPVHFINFADSNAYAAHHETDAVLDSLFYHPSHPPFMAIRMIQRFGISNPSPSFIERVSTAYSTGSYAGFGSVKYGDMGALVAAIILDDEARQVVLDSDQSHGHLREPLIKLISFFRSMGLSFNRQPLMIPSLIDQQGMIGQGSFESPSVFSFFLPEFTPAGVAQSAGLFVPESMVLSGSKVLWLLDGMMSTIKFGLVNNSPKCKQMMAYLTFSNYGQRLMECPDEEGIIDDSPAHATYVPSSMASVDAILDEMSTLLTSGRLRSHNRQLIKPIVEQAFNSGDIPKAVRIAQQLIFATPEFHATNIPRKQNTAREISSYNTLPSQPYKAVVVLMMIGGADSFNMLVPKCNDAYQEYTQARRRHALPKTSLTSVTATGQGTCSDWGVNNLMSTVADHYKAGQALFFANTGTLTKKMTNQDDYIKESRFQLYAHNSMQHEFFTGDPLEKNAGTGVFGRMLDVLKLRGYHTSANAVVGYGDKMLTGDQLYNNPVTTVGTVPPRELNLSPTITNLYDVVKQLNGEGELGNSFLGETWSTRVSTALFEHEQMVKISNDDRFEVKNYPVGYDEQLGLQFQAVAEYMLSREYRNVTRDVFIVPHTGYDLHFADALAELFLGANDALGAFITWAKSENLWDNTGKWRSDDLIIMGSDFGRTMNANSNGGTDHAWGGNYFMMGGKVRGGRILGDYPRPLSPDSSSWIGRGRFIPTTPWDAVWNGVGNWLGVPDVDMDFVLPNRYNFNKCNDLFFDKDLFTDGVCDCNTCSGPPTPPLPNPTPPPTNPPTVFQTPAPTKQGDTQSPTKQPVTSQPTPNPTPNPTNQPVTPPSPQPTTPLPTVSPTIDTHCEGNLLENGNFEDPAMGFWRGWGSEIRLTNGVTGNAIEGYNRSTFRSGPRQDLTLKDLSCLPVGSTLYVSFKTKLIDQTTGEGVACDPLTITSCPMVTLRHASWDYITDPYMQWDPTGWNSFHGQYEVTSEWSSTAYIMISGGAEGTIVVADDISLTVTDSTSEPTPLPTVAMTQPPTGAPIPSVPVNDNLVNNVIDKESAVIAFGCSENNNVLRRAFDETTEKFFCTKTVGATEHGIIVTPSQASIVNSLRVYAHNNCPNCDAVTYRVEGRLDSGNVWVEIGSGSLPWFDTVPNRNSRWLDISSSYNSGDTSLTFTEVFFPTNDQAFAEYKLSFDETREPNAAYLQFSEVELPGTLVGGYTAPPTTSTFQPTPQPTGTPTASPTAPPTVVTFQPTPQPTGVPTALPIANPTQVPTTGSTTGTGIGDLLGEYANTILDADSTIVDVGCTADQSAVSNQRAIDRTTEKFVCFKSGTENPGIIVTPSHGLMSIVTKLRVYAHNNCPGCDAVCYKVEGRSEASADWSVISEGHFPWLHTHAGSNARGLAVSSTYESGDTNLVYTEVFFTNNTVPYLEYRLTFPQTRDPTSYLQFSELDLPGFLISADPTSVPTTLSPVVSPPTTGSAGTPVNNIFDTASVGVTVGCTSSYDNTKTHVFDHTTAKFICFKLAPELPGIEVTPSHGQLSIAQSLRVYSQNNCPNCDAVTYKVQGRVDSSSPWILIGEGDLPWKDVAPGRNAKGITIASTYESADTAFQFTEVFFPSNNEKYLEYRLQFPETRDPNSYLQLAEVELVGLVF